MLRISSGGSHPLLLGREGPPAQRLTVRRETRMRDNTVVAEQNVQPTALRFARRFNVAVPFIDRHLDEGRGGQVAIRSAVEDVSYAALAERVARCGNALRRLELPPRARL